MGLSLPQLISYLFAHNDNSSIPLKDKILYIVLNNNFKQPII